jgi:hypothetical protein
MKQEKQCSKCEKIKPIELFTIVKGKPGSWCKECKAESDRQYRTNHKEDVKIKKQAYYDKNKEEISAYKKEWYENNKTEILEDRKKNYETNREEILRKNALWRAEHKEQKAEQDRKYRETHKEECDARAKRYREEHIEERREYDRSRPNKDERKAKINAYHKNRRQNDVQFRLTCMLRSRLYNVLAGRTKAGSAVRDLGCTPEELQVYLESQFHPNPITGEMMTWENSDKWEIDHIRPLALFDLTDREQFLAACNFSNLQPLWKEEHIIKTTEDVRLIREIKANQDITENTQNTPEPEPTKEVMESETIMAESQSIEITNA